MPNQIPPEALWINRGTPKGTFALPAGTLSVDGVVVAQVIDAVCKPAVDTMAFPPRPIGVCRIPPRGILFQHYQPLLDGPLVDCIFDTAAYSAEARARFD